MTSRSGDLPISLLREQGTADTVYLMVTRINVPIDKSNRASLTKLGFTEGMAVAEELQDGSGWILRPAEVLTRAELDIRTRPQNTEDIEAGLLDIGEGRLLPRERR